MSHVMSSYKVYAFETNLIVALDGRTQCSKRSHKEGLDISKVWRHTDKWYPRGKSRIDRRMGVNGHGNKHNEISTFLLLSTHYIKYRSNKRERDSNRFRRLCSRA